MPTDTIEKEFNGMKYYLSPSPPIFTFFSPFSGYNEEWNERIHKEHLRLASESQILALRRALGWSRQTLGRYLGLYVNPKDCYTIYRWEKGLARPAT